MEFSSSLNVTLYDRGKFVDGSTRIGSSNLGLSGSVVKSLADKEPHSEFVSYLKTLILNVVCFGESTNWPLKYK